MNPLTLLLPILLGIALLVGALSGYVSPEQLAAGAALLLVPGADRFGPLLRQLLRPGQRPEFETVDDDDALEHTYRVFDAERKRSGDDRLLWKKYMLAALQGQIGVAPTAPAPAEPGQLLMMRTEEVHRLAGVAYESYAAATGGKTFDGRPMPTWDEARERIGHAWAAAVTGVMADQANQPILRLVPPAAAPAPAAPPPTPPPAALLPLLVVLSWGCSPALRGALLACAAAEVSPTVSAAAELALHQGEGWQAALARLVLSAGECAVRAAVRAVADRPPAAQPMGLMTAGAGVSPQEVQARAQSWIKGRR